MNQRAKASLSLICLAISAIYLVIIANRLPYATWDFGFLVEPTIATGGLTNRYVQRMHSLSPVVVSAYSMVQTVLGVDHTTVLYIPLAFAIAPLIYSLLDDLPTSLRAVVTAISMLGPVTILPMYLYLRREGIDILIILTCIVLISRLSKSRHQYTLLVAISGSCFLWFTHYSAWPFLAAYLIIFTFLRSGANISMLIPIGALIPLGISINQASVYLHYLAVIPSLSPTDMLFRLTSIFGGRAEIPATAIKIEKSIPTPEPWWMPELQLAMFGLGLLILIVIWAIASIRFWGGVHDYLFPASNSCERHEFLSAMGAFLVLTAGFLIAGYKTRTLFIWPVVVPLGIREVWIRSNPPEISPRKYSRTISAICLILLAAVMVPVATPQYHSPTERPGITTAQQQASAVFAQYIDGTVTTDLQHANVMFIKTDHRNVEVGRAYPLPDGGLAADKTLAKLYHEVPCHGYVLYSKANGMIVWGSTIPAVIPSKSKSTIYTNGANVWQKCYIQK